MAHMERAETLTALLQKLLRVESAAASWGTIPLCGDFEFLVCLVSCLSTATRNGHGV
jgi:hypothetical protein